MKLTDYLLPYPVLGIPDAFDSKCIADGTMTFETTLDNFIFHIHLTMDDDHILKLIKDDKAVFACEVDCPKTYYRKIFESKELEFQIQINRTTLVGNVQFFFSVVATTNIEGYKNPNSNQRYYSGYVFNLQKGHMLAYMGEQNFNADIKYDELKALGSIVEVKKDAHENYTHFDFSSDKIRIFLPEEEFNNFNLTNNHRFADITHASIVQCALFSALYSFKHYKHTLWAQTLDMRVKTDTKLKQFENIEELDDLQICKFVDLLLGNANKRMFESIKSIQKDND